MANFISPIPSGTRATTVNGAARAATAGEPADDVNKLVALIAELRSQLGSVDNTTDLLKPLSTAATSALAARVTVAGALAGSATAPTLAANSVGAAQVADGSMGLPELAAAVKAELVAPWAANTVYAALQPVVNPSGAVVAARTAHTSAATYSGATNWFEVAGAAGAVQDTPFGMLLPGAGVVDSGASNGEWYFPAAGYVTYGHLSLGAAPGGGSYTAQLYNKVSGATYLSLAAAAGATVADVTGTAVQIAAGSRVGVRRTTVGAAGTEGSDATVQFGVTATAPAGVPVTQPTAAPAATTAVITRGNVSSGSNNATLSTSINWAHTVASGVTQLVIAVGNSCGTTASGVLDTPAAVTCTAGTATRIGRTQTTSGYGRNVELWSVPNPAAGAATITVTAAIPAGATQTGFAITGTATGYAANYGLSPAPVTAMTASATSVSAAVTDATRTGSLVLAACCARATAGPAVGGTGGTLVQSALAVTNDALSFAEFTGGSASVTPTFTIGAADQMALAAVTLGV